MSKTALMTHPAPEIPPVPGSPLHIGILNIRLLRAGGSDAGHSPTRGNAPPRQISSFRVTTVINMSTAAPVRDSGRMTTSY